MQAVVPEDVKISLEFDQSRYVVDAIRSLINEGVLGAVLPDWWSCFSCAIGAAP